MTNIVNNSTRYWNCQAPTVTQIQPKGNNFLFFHQPNILVPTGEVPERKIATLKEVGIGGVYAVGNTSEPLCQIPIALNRIGVVQLGGLNPGAVEAGIKIENIAESGLIDFQQLRTSENFSSLIYPFSYPNIGTNVCYSHIL